MYSSTEGCDCTDPDDEEIFGLWERTITDDSDCGSDGIYSYDLSDDELILTAGSDECSQRKMMLEAEWERVE